MDNDTMTWFFDHFLTRLRGIVFFFIFC